MTKIRKVLLVAALFVGAAALAGYVAYASNVAPTVRPISTDEVASSVKPFVVKLHAQWCPKCLVTKDMWSQIEEAYAGRVHLVVFDFTNDVNTEAGRREAARLGLTPFFEEWVGITGTIVVLDGRSKAVTASIDASRDFGEYRAAIDPALKAVM